MSYHRLLLVAIVSLFALGVVCSQSADTSEAIPDGAITTSQQGIDGGYFYSFWNAGGGTVYMTLGADGNYSTRWIDCNNFTAGKGWKVGGRKTVHYVGSFDAGRNGYLVVYGWTFDPLVEYYIVENHGGWNPPRGTAIGSVVSYGGTYKIYKTRRINQPSIIGTATFDQFWSVRRSGRASGTVTTANHFDAWAALGMTLGAPPSTTCSWQPRDTRAPDDRLLR